MRIGKIVCQMMIFSTDHHFLIFLGGLGSMILLFLGHPFTSKTLSVSFFDISQCYTACFSRFPITPPAYTQTHILYKMEIVMWLAKQYGL